MENIFEYRLHFTNYTMGMAKISYDLDMIGYYYVVRQEYTVRGYNYFRMMGSTRVNDSGWHNLVKCLKKKYGTIKFHKDKQAFIFSDDADEAAFILENSNGFDV